jgi:hypothetical protein
MNIGYFPMILITDHDFSGLIFILFNVPCENLSPLPVMVCKKAYARRSGPLNREGSLSCYIFRDTDLGLCGLTQRPTPFSCLLRKARGIEGLF